MKRYIDADALENRVEDFEKLTGMKLDIVHDFVSSQPTVDAVEVIRCKDCKYYEGLYWCGLNKTNFDPDEFCSYAERKEE